MCLKLPLYYKEGNAVISDTCYIKKFSTQLETRAKKIFFTTLAVDLNIIDIFAVAASIEKSFTELF